MDRGNWTEKMDKKMGGENAERKWTEKMDRENGQRKWT